MAGTNLGTAYVTIMPSTKGISGFISSALGGEASAAGTKSGNLFTTALKGVLTGAAVAAVGKFFKDAIEEGGKLQQSFGGLDTIYGDAAEGMKEMAYQASQAGISANDYAEQAVSFGASLKQAFGGDTVKAAKAADTAIMDMADNAAKMGTDMGSIQMAYQGFAKQNYTMLDNLKLGYGGTKTEMERLLKDAQALTGVEYNIDNLGDVYEAIHVIQGELGLTGVAAQEGAETFSGSMNAMKASAKNLLANLSLGEDISGPLHDLAQNTSNFLFGNLFPMIGNILKQLPGLIGEALLWAFDNIPSAIDAVIGFINNLADGIGNNSGVFVEKLKEIGHAAMEAFKNIDWKGLGLAVLNLLVTGLKELGSILWEGLKAIGQTAWDWFQDIDWKQAGKDAITFIWNGLGEIGSWIWEKLKAIGQTAKTKFKNVEWLELGKTVIKTIWSGLGAIGSWIWEKLKALGQTAKTQFANIDWLELGKTVIRTIWNGLGAIGSWIWEKLKSLGQIAKTQFENIEWLELGKSVITFIWDGLGELGHTIWEKLKEIGEKAVGWLLGTDGESDIDWKQLGLDIISAIVGGIVELGHTIWETLGGIGQKALDWLTGKDPESGLNWKNASTTITDEISVGLRESSDVTLRDASNYMASVIATAVYGWEYDYYGVGQNIVAGIVNGMASYMEVARNMAIGIANYVTSAFTGIQAFGINSPSKTMRDKVGKWIPAGIAEGIEQNMGVLDGALDDIVKSTVSDFDMDLSHNVSLSGGELTNAATSPITINVYPSAGMDERALADMVQQRLALAQRQRQAAWGV